jgi:hypothetical protein
MVKEDINELSRLQCQTTLARKSKLDGIDFDSKSVASSFDKFPILNKINSIDMTANTIDLKNTKPKVFSHSVNRKNKEQ